ncbi:hypothetical protein LXL04_006967 [Taraxacum kok-saghyz]
MEKKVLINCRNNKKLLGRVRAFDRHCNMVLEMLERCGLRYPKQEKARRKLFRLTKTDLLVRCFFNDLELWIST